MNLEKTHFIQFNNKGKCTSTAQIKYEDKQISVAKETKFLGLYINNNLSWKTHTESIQSKLSSACYAMRSVKPYVTTNTLKSIYYSNFHSVSTYGLLFWGNSQTAQRSLGCKRRWSELWWAAEVETHVKKFYFNLEILPLPSQYILSLLLFMIRNKNQFLINSGMYHTNTRQHANLHQPSVNVTKYQKGVYCLGVKVFNMLPPYIKTVW